MIGRVRWPSPLFVVLVVIRLAAAGSPAGAVPPPPHSSARPAPSDDWSGLERATVTRGPNRNELILELPPVDLPAGTVLDETASVGEFPVTGSVYALHAELVDGDDRRLPNELLHHLNVMDPSQRELFLPIARRILAVGMETGEIRFPWLLFGARIQAGQRVLANAMVHNSTTAELRGVRVRLVLRYVPEHRPWPVFSVLPWQLDVAFPVGNKSFDLPPGRSERRYEGSPAVPGKLVVIGGHLHAYGRTIELWDATSGALLWHGEPAPAPPGEASAVPVGRLYGLTGLGLRVVPAHRYRVRVVYDNPTGRAIVGGGMGVVGGVFIPDRDVAWPATDPSDSLYQQDLRHFIGAVGTPGISVPMADMPMGGGH